MRSVSIFLVVLCCCLPFPAGADLGAQRAAFPDALRAAKRGNAEVVERYRESLATYPLYPYLDYYLLGNAFDSATPESVADFISRNPGLPVNARLRRDWLTALARRGRWGEFVASWNDSRDTTLRCHWVNARLRTGGEEDADVLATATDLWLAGRSQPDACDPVFAWLESSGNLTEGLIQQRMELALEARQYSLATWLARRLDEADRDFVRRWHSMQDAPARALSARSLPPDTERERRLVFAGLERLARIDPSQAREHLQRLEENYRFDETQRTTVLRTAAVISAQRHQPDAGRWLADIAGSDFAVDEWRVRAALRAEDWPAVTATIAALPQALQEQSGWRYWQARAAEQAGNEDSAHSLYLQLSDERGYHAWLAADRIGRPYEISSTANEVDDSLLAELSEQPAFQRAREFLALGMQPEARAEWAAATAGMDSERLVQAALLAEQWQWHAQAIATVNRAGQFDNLEMRFPTMFSQQIIPHASAQGLDPSLVYSLVRSESLFVPDARSGAGALGLMQLMPGTGREVARRIGLPLSGNNALLDPETNVRLGSAYLSSVMQRFDSHEVLATAAYNAGPARVRRWLPQEGTLPADVWVETIPFNETRAYVRQVMGGTAIFDWRLGREVRPLTSRMQDIPATTD